MAEQIFDLSNRTCLRLTGKDSRKFLHNLTTNNILSLEPGTGCEAFVTNVKARCVGHVYVWATEDSLLLDSSPGQAQPLIEHLDRYIITEDVSIEDLTESTHGFYVSGPMPEQFESLDITARISSWFGLPGEYLLISDAEAAQTFLNSAEEGGLSRASFAEWEAFRIQHVLPEYERDITEDHLAPEVGRNELAISYEKGCYLGQEPIARIRALGHVNRELRGLSIEGQVLPEVGAEIFAEDKKIGVVTSAAQTETGGVALGYIRMKWASAGTTVAVEASSGQISATVFERKA
ncbi:CAF17-like 4Fe-4S cluster assembly/insertion protein YgfZ [Calycomorphotria hydatis]|uniref:tRNA-modifying protein YgfZ n=1 Tax=Calycomorphotria hydatis TaxID=2528027 RepID=A0A517TBT2_9PLAN|nr:glycine cleavage T C-terminal barrel domain-containing protein [Calycomorphotria hydatis]QDT65824.1 tRNA-modifying protein YgfZ [Calycomorphotria hydatis]